MAGMLVAGQGSYGPALGPPVMVGPTSGSSAGAAVPQPPPVGGGGSYGASVGLGRPVVGPVYSGSSVGSSTPLVAGGSSIPIAGAATGQGAGFAPSGQLAANDPCGCGPNANAGDCAGACGGYETVCCEATGATNNVQWVHASGGSYSRTMSYQYVGEGSGAYTKQVVTQYYGWRCRKCCIAFACLALLAPLLYLLSALLTPGGLTSETPDGQFAPSPAPTPPPSPPVPPFVTPEIQPMSPRLGPPPRTCMIYGDPHIKTFDGQRADYYTPGEYWIVRSSSISIQGKYRPTTMTGALSVTKEIGVSGTFISGHKLVIGVDDVLWDGKPVMEGFDKLNTHWHNMEPDVSIMYSDHGKVMQKSRVGKALHVVHVRLPNGVRLQVNRWNEAGESKYMNIVLEMQPEAGQDGHCGNYNNDPEDDRRTAVRERVGKKGVSENELIFSGPKTPINPSGRPDLNDCPEGELSVAMEKCKAAENKFFPSHACLIDTCFGHLAPKPA